MPWYARPSSYSSKLISHGNSSGSSSESCVMPPPPMPPPIPPGPAGAVLSVESSVPSGSSMPSGISPFSLPPPMLFPLSDCKVELPLRRRPTFSIKVPSIVISARIYSFSPSSRKVLSISSYSAWSKVMSMECVVASKSSASPSMSLTITVSETSSEVMYGRTIEVPNASAIARHTAIAAISNFQWWRRRTGRRWRNEVEVLLVGCSSECDMVTYPSGHSQ